MTWWTVAFQDGFGGAILRVKLGGLHQLWQVCSVAMWCSIWIWWHFHCAFVRYYEPHIGANLCACAHCGLRTIVLEWVCVCVSLCICPHCGLCRYSVSFCTSTSMIFVRGLRCPRPMPGGSEGLAGHCKLLEITWRSKLSPNKGWGSHCKSLCQSICGVPSNVCLLENDLRMIQVQKIIDMMWYDHFNVLLLLMHK